VTKAGGIVTITVEVSIPADQRDGLRQTIASIYSLAASDVELRSVPFKAGSVRLSYAGETGGGDFARQIAGNGPALLSGAERATFVVDLTGEGAALLWQAIDRRLDTFQLTYDLVFDHRLANVHMRVWCDARKSLSAADPWIKAGGADPAKLRAALADQRLAGVEVIADEPLPPEHLAASQKAGDDLLTRAIA